MTLTEFRRLYPAATFTVSSGKKFTYGTNSSTPLVKKITQNGISFEYEYDSRGNITSEKRGNLTTTYQYDALGQLIRVNDPHENATWVYNYDRGGNILSKVKYAYTTGAVGTAIETIPYVYGDSNWKDKLTSYNGQTITYDAIGNPLNDGTWTYTWQAGRQLKQMNAEGASVSFKYDHNGMRVQKVVEQSWYPETTNYTYHGKLLTHMTVDYTDFDEVAHQDKLHFFYDAQSRPTKVEFNGTAYTYLHNLQGDVVGLLDSSGTLVVEYKYDAWGKPLSTTGTLAGTLGKRNPFRYRGYVFDEETGLYYLRSRYYCPEPGRFINADVIQNSYSCVLHNNLFCYCLNNPTAYADSEGRFALLAIGFGSMLTMVAEAVAVAVVYTACAVATVVAAVEVTETITEVVQSRTYDRIQDEAITDVQTQVKTESKSKRNKYHLHHIVAKADARAYLARRILWSYQIDVFTNKENLVYVPAEYHVHLHTNTYYKYVTAKLYYASRTGGRMAVLATLRQLKYMISSGNIPY